MVTIRFASGPPLACFAAGFFFLVHTLGIVAATRTWDGLGSNDYWSTAANWNPNIAPVSGDDLVFAGAAPVVSTNNFANGSRTFHSLTFSAINYDIRGNDIRVSNGIEVTHGTGLTRLRPLVELTANQTVHVPQSFAGLSFDSYLHVLSGCTISNSGPVAVALDLSGSGVVSKRGPGLLTLEGPVGVAQLIIYDGTIWANGSGGSFSLRENGTLRGHGTVASIDATQGGTVHPGDNGHALLTVSGNTLLGNALTTFRVVVSDDSLPGIGYDALWTQQFSLGSGSQSASLSVVLGRAYLPVIGQAFRIINVNNPNPVSGTFAGLPQGGTFTASNVTFQITYTGFSGNDVIISVVQIGATGTARTWDGGGADNYWTNRFNWVGDTAPSSGDSLVFPPGAARPLNTNNFPVGVVFDSINVGASGYTLRGNQLTLLSGLQTTYAAGSSTVALPLRLGADQSFANGAAGTVTISGTISLDNHDLTFQNDGGSVTMSGAINGLGSINKQGPGNVTLSAGNSYFGLTRVFDGRLTLMNDNALGQNFSGTIITNTGTLYLAGGISIYEPLTLASTGGGANGVLVNQENTNELSGDITLLVDTRVGAFGSVGQLTLSGAISGPGGLQKTGPRPLFLRGATDNTYSGETWALQGLLFLGKVRPRIAVPANLRVGDGIGGAEADEVRIFPGFDPGPDPNQIADTSAVTVQSSGLLRINAATETIGSLTGNGSVHLPNGHLVVGSNGLSTTFSGPIYTSIPGALSKVGTGTLTLSGTNYIDVTFVHDGKLIINGLHYSAVDVDGGTLGGVGQLSNLQFGFYQLHMTGGTLDPGASPGVFHALLYVQALDPTSIFRFELNGITPGSGYDQLEAQGFGPQGAVLQVLPGIALTNGQTFMIVNNTGASSVLGTFAGLPEGAIFSAGGQDFQITYQGGDGNDVVLTRVGGQVVNPIMLNIAPVMGGLRIAWPLPGTGFFLDQTPTLSRMPIPWMEVSESFYQTNSSEIFIVVPARGSQFFRLRRP